MCFQVAVWAGVNRIVFACRKTQYLIDMGCYEGSNDLSDINKNNQKKITVEYLDGYSDDSFDLVRKWERGIKVN